VKRDQRVGPPFNPGNLDTGSSLAIRPRAPFSSAHRFGLADVDLVGPALGTKNRAGYPREAANPGAGTLGDQTRPDGPDGSFGADQGRQAGGKTGGQGLGRSQHRPCWGRILLPLAGWGFSQGPQGIFNPFKVLARD